MNYICMTCTLPVRIPCKPCPPTLVSCLRTSRLCNKCYRASCHYREETSCRRQILGEGEFRCFFQFRIPLVVAWLLKEVILSLLALLWLDMSINFVSCFFLLLDIIMQFFLFFFKRRLFKQRETKFFSNQLFLVTFLNGSLHVTSLLR